MKFSFGMVCFLAATLGCPALTVRVESPQGAPRLVVDGKPVRARMFYGGPGYAALPIAPEGKEIDFEFIASGSAENGTLHFRFGRSAGWVRLDDIHVTDLDDKKDVVPLCDFSGGQADFDKDWQYWPLGAANTVGKIAVEDAAGRGGSAGLGIRLTAPADGQWPDFHIYHHTNLHFTEGHHYRVQLWAQAVPARSLSVEFHRPGKSFVRIGGPPDPFVQQIRLAADAGVNFVTFPVPLPWPKPGEAEDWQGVDAVCQQVLDTNPNALLIPRVPMNAPIWWSEAFPDDVMVWEGGLMQGFEVVASEHYRHDAAQRLTAFINHVEAKFGDHVAGYHPSGQNTGEWFYEDTWKPLLSGYAPADLTGWRKWLKLRYASDEKLRAAWHDPLVSIDTVPVLSAASRHEALGGIFRDPAKEQSLVDWGRYQQDAMASCVCQLAKAARQASKGQKLVIFFYGYLHELAGVMNGPATSGHFALRQVLNSPDIDVLCSPIAYFDRGLGGSAPSMTAAESVALAGKMWLNEDDTHTYIATGDPPGFKEHVDSLEDTNGELVRNVSQEALRNFGTWWMDLTQTGWYNDAGMWQQMAKLNAVDQALLDKPTPFSPEIAVVVDEEVMLHVAAKAEVVTRPAVYEARARLGRLGAPYGQYMLDDVVAGKVKAKLFVFLNAWKLNQSQREQLEKAVKGSVCVWCYATGHFNNDDLTPSGTKSITGFDLAPLINVKATATPTELGRKAGLLKPWGVPFPLLPLSGAKDATPAETLATFPNGSAAVALREGVNGGASIVSSPPGVTTELLRFAARKAGVHLYCETDCNVYANGPFIAVCAPETGSYTLDTGNAGAVTDVMSGAALGQGPKVVLSLKKGETRVLRVGE